MLFTLKLVPIWGFLLSAANAEFSSVVSETVTLTLLGGVGSQGDIDPYSETCLAPYTNDCYGSSGCIATECQDINACSGPDAEYGPAYFAGDFHPWGNMAGTNQWINQAPNFSEGLNQETFFRIRFQAPEEFSDIDVQFQITSDNYARMYLNGIQFAPNEQWEQAQSQSPVMDLSDIDGCDGDCIKPGLNEILLMQGDCGGMVGFNYRIDITAVAQSSFVVGEAGDNCIVCSMNADCHVDETSSTSTSCSCKEGYVGDGETCDDVDECANSSPCDDNAVCTNTPGSYTCACQEGFTGDGQSCDDVDECANSSPCDDTEVCTNTPGSYSCAEGAASIVSTPMFHDRASTLGLGLTAACFGIGLQVMLTVYN
jgi:hypothetical protein